MLIRCILNPTARCIRQLRTRDPHAMCDMSVNSLKPAARLSRKINKFISLIFLQDIPIEQWEICGNNKNVHTPFRIRLALRK